MGRRHRQREKLTAPTSAYRNADGAVLTLRGSMTPATRLEFLFERLVVEWEIGGVSTSRQKELLGRFRIASADERQFVRDTLREHLAAHFPELQAP